MVSTWTPEREQMLLDMIDKNMTLRQISKKMNLGTHAISVHAKKIIAARGDRIDTYGGFPIYAKKLFTPLVTEAIDTIRAESKGKIDINTGIEVFSKSQVYDYIIKHHEEEIENVAVSTRYRIITFIIRDLGYQSPKSMRYFWKETK